MRPTLSVLLLLVLLAACATPADAPSHGAGVLPDLNARQPYRVRHNVTISNVYVATSAYLSGGSNAILRFPAGDNTSTPNKSVSLTITPTKLAVSPFNGRVAVTGRVKFTFSIRILVSSIASRALSQRTAKPFRLDMT